MNKELTDCFERFWAAYPNRKSKGAAGRAFEKVMKNVDPQELTKEIILAIDAQKRYRRHAEKNGEFLPNWKYPGTWLNAEAWLDEIPSISDSSQNKTNQITKLCQCGLPVHGPEYSKCDYCYSRDANPFEFNLMRQKYVELKMRDWTPKDHINFINEKFGIRIPNTGR